MRKSHRIRTLNATAPRPTKGAALILAIVLSVPVFIGLTLLDWLL